MKKNSSVLVLCLVFLIVSGWYGSSVLSDMASFNDWDKPAEIAKMWKAGVMGLIGVALAAGLDLKAMLGPFGAFLPGAATAPVVVSEETRAALNEKVGG